jgi:hypothetical protein
MVRANNMHASSIPNRKRTCTGKPEEPQAIVKLPMNKQRKNKTAMNPSLLKPSTRKLETKQT